MHCGYENLDVRSSAIEKSARKLLAFTLDLCKEGSLATVTQ